MKTISRTVTREFDADGHVVKEVEVIYEYDNIVPEPLVGANGYIVPQNVC